ncbi:MAG TPA: hypothetical protein VMK12_18900 [Anaeromyxobacteraceae bacterium]|nr:hypothetical protein [Anaeromyxobacteraceae bacterium]
MAIWTVSQRRRTRYIYDAGEALAVPKPDDVVPAGNGAWLYELFR